MRQGNALERVGDCGEKNVQKKWHEAGRRGAGMGAAMAAPQTPRSGPLWATGGLRLRGRGSPGATPDSPSRRHPRYDPVSGVAGGCTSLLIFDALFRITSMDFEALSKTLLFRWQYLSVVTMFACPNMDFTS